MKVPIHEVSGLDSMSIPANPPVARFDIRSNVDTDFISLFKTEEGSGTIYLMLLTNFGSVSNTLSTTDTNIYSVVIKCYPHLLHALKGSNFNTDIPSAIGGMHKKLQKISAVIDNFSSNKVNLCGFRYEFEVRARRRLGYIFDMVKHTGLTMEYQMVLLWCNELSQHCMLKI